jgi:hypothetical protein
MLVLSKIIVKISLAQSYTDYCDQSLLFAGVYVTPWEGVTPQWCNIAVLSGNFNDTLVGQKKM